MMKKIVLFIVVTLLFLNLDACKKTIDDEPLDLSYGFLLENVWEKYLIESYFKNTDEVENIEQFDVLGYYKYHKDVGEDYSARFYLGDEGREYNLDFLITFDENSDLEFQHFHYTYSDITYFGNPSLNNVWSLQEVDLTVSLEQTIETIKANYVNIKQRSDENYQKFHTDQSIYEFEFIEDSYQIKEIDHYIDVNLDIKLSDQIYYMIGETEASVVGYNPSESYGNYEIRSEIDGKPVTKIYEGAFRQAQIGILTIPQSVKEFGYKSFDSSIILSIAFKQESQLRLIREKAFHNSLIRDFVIPISVTMIEKDAFENIPNLSGIYAEAPEKPDGWHEYWIDEDFQVQWGYSKESID